MFFNMDENRTSFGRAAIEEYLNGYEGRLMQALKSVLGTSLMESGTELMGRSLDFRGLLSQFVKELKRRSEASAQKEFTDAVFGRPIHFVDDDPVADKKAESTLREVAEEAGFRHIEFQYEPLAAAFDMETRATTDSLVMVADIGAGTSDFSLIRLGPDRVHRADRKDDILANAGVHIGGGDYDKVLSLRKVMPELGLGTLLAGDKPVPSTQYNNLAGWHTIPVAYTRRAWNHLSDVYNSSLDRAKLGKLLKVVQNREGHAIALKVEKNKIDLSTAEAADIELADTVVGTNIASRREEFDDAAADLNQKIVHTITDMLHQANVQSTQVDSILFTGGTTSIPAVKNCIATMFPAARQHQGDLFGAVALGLAVDARRKFGA